MTRIPQRTCVSCRTRRDQHDLLRFARRRDGEVVSGIARRTRPSGRCAYVCPTDACMQRAVTRRALTRSLGSNGLVTRTIAEPQTLRAATELALDQEIETLSNPAALAPVRLPQLRRLRHALHQTRSA